MKYHTRHKLEIVKGNDGHTNYKDEISVIADYNHLFNDSCKWYDHEADMREYSKKHPNTLFKLIGDGEEKGDMWHEYYLNGKMQRINAKIVFDEFDKSKLK